MTAPTARELRHVDVLLALSLAIDLTQVRSLEHGMRCAILASRFASEQKLGDAVAREGFYYVLLRLLGCSADAPDLARVVNGDEMAIHAPINRADWTSPPSMVKAIVTNVGRGKPLPARLRDVAHAARNASLVEHAHLTHCEIAVALAEQLGLDDGVRQALAQAGEAWNGKGGPHKIKGEAIRPSVRVGSLIEDYDTFHGEGGADHAVAIIRSRRGSIHDPKLVDAWLAAAPRLYAALDGAALWDTAVAEAARDGALLLDDAAIDRALGVMADYADFKSSFTRGHSRAVSRIAEAAARCAGLAAHEQVLARRAGLVHDVGRVAVAAFLWDKPARLSESEQERMRTHAYFTERVLARPAFFASLGAVAGLDHERVDGAGYPRRVSGPQLPMVARIVAAADAWDALTSRRAWRPAYATAEARSIIEGEVKAQHLDADAVRAVLAAEGLGETKRKGELTVQLTERELDVLRVLALGKTNKEIAEELAVSPKTVDNHVQAIFAKLQVRTRAAATLWAMRAGLLA